jgi:hypothetical protein
VAFLPLCSSHVVNQVGVWTTCFLGGGFRSRFFCGGQGFRFAKAFWTLFVPDRRGFHEGLQSKILWYAAFSHLTQEQRNLSFPAFDEPRQDFASSLVPNTKRLGCALPITPVGTHADGAALKVA